MARIAVSYEPVAAHGVVGHGVGAVEADLDVEVVHRREPASALPASMNAPFVENFTPMPSPIEYSSSSKKSRRIIGSPPPMLM